MSEKGPNATFLPDWAISALPCFLNGLRTTLRQAPLKAIRPVGVFLIFLKVREERKRTSRILFGYLSGQSSSAADYDTNEYLAESAIPVTKLHTMAE
jgi:hypothetical protein